MSQISTSKMILADRQTNSVPVKRCLWPKPFCHSKYGRKLRFTMANHELPWSTMHELPYYFMVINYVLLKGTVDFDCGSSWWPMLNFGFVVIVVNFANMENVGVYH